MRAIKLHAGGWGEIAVIRTFFFPSFFLKGKGGGGAHNTWVRGKYLYYRAQSETCETCKVLRTITSIHKNTELTLNM